MVVLILILGFLLKKNDSKLEEQKGYKTNTNANIIKDQTIEDLKFTNTSLQYKEGISTLRVEITNQSNEDRNITELKAHIYDKDKNEIVTLKAFLGEKLKSKESKKIEITYAEDLTDAESLEYEIMK